jgi:putative transposase
MVQLEKFRPGALYHIHNEGNNKEPLFIENRNFPYFLRLWHKYLSPLSDAYAYCLLRNQFHFLIRIKETPELIKASGIKKQITRMPQLSNFVSLQFAHLFNAYSKSFNKAYDRTGSLFRERFRRNSVCGDAEITALIYNIHTHPEKQGLCNSFMVYPYSSYSALLGQGPTRLNRDEVFHYFSGRSGFIKYHRHHVHAERPFKINGSGIISDS